MRVRPVSRDALVAELAERLAGEAATSAVAGGRLRVAIDGAPAADPGSLADALVDPLRVLGRPAIRIATDDFLRPASVRFEAGRTNPDALYAGWLDEAGVRREVLDPLAPGGSGRILTALWNADTDRASRTPYHQVPVGAVVLVSGALLLGAGLPFDVAVHLELSPAALARRTAPELDWTLPAFARYRDEVDPSAFADVVVRLDDPRRPAVVLGGT